MSTDEAIDFDSKNTFKNIVLWSGTALRTGEEGREGVTRVGEYQEEGSKWKFL